MTKAGERLLDEGKEARTMSHTPGPWATEFVGDTPVAHGASDRPTVCFVGDYRVVRDGAGARGYDLHGTDEADASLIAAAPDMYAALAALVGDSAEGMRFSDRIKLATEALAKATTGTPARIRRTIDERDG